MGRGTSIRDLPMLDAAPAACCAPIGAPSMTAEEAATTSAAFKALADPHRVLIVNLLATSQEAVCGCDLEEPLGLSQATVSFHLGKLRDAGLLEREQRGRWAYYRLNREVLFRLGAALDPGRR
jgi:ArsR family transcriptional regulator